MIKNHQYKRAISVGATAASIIKRFAMYASLRYIAYKEGLLRKGIEKMLSNQLSTNFINNDIIPTIVSHVVSVSVAKHKKGNKIITQEIAEVPITGSTLTYVYTGNEQSIDIDISNILVKNVNFLKNNNHLIT
jgi:hypothetical protein